MCNYKLFVFRCGHVATTQKPTGPVCDRLDAVLAAAGFPQDLLHRLRAPTDPLRPDPDCSRSRTKPGSAAAGRRRSQLLSTAEDAEDADDAHPARPAPRACACADCRLRATRLPRCPVPETAIPMTFRLSRPCYDCFSHGGRYLAQQGRWIQRQFLDLPVRATGGPASPPPRLAVPTDASAPGTLAASVSNKFLVDNCAKSFSQLVRKRPTPPKKAPSKYEVAEQFLSSRLTLTAGLVSPSPTSTSGSTAASYGRTARSSVVSELPIDESTELSASAFETHLQIQPTLKRMSSDSDSGYAESFQGPHRPLSAAPTALGRLSANLLSHTGSATGKRDSVSADPGLADEDRIKEMSALLGRRSRASLAFGSPAGLSKRNSEAELEKRVNDMSELAGTARWDRFNEWIELTARTAADRQRRSWTVVPERRIFKLFLLDPVLAEQLIPGII